MQKSVLCAAIIALVSATSAKAAPITVGASFDTDSYVHSSTNAQYDPTMTLGIPGEYPDADNPHYNFGFIEFDSLGSFSSSAGKKFLCLESSVHPLVSENTSGTVNIKIAGLGKDRLNYYAQASAADRHQWILDNATSKTSVTMAVNAPGIYYADVTDIVNGWLNNSSTNHGFGIWASNGYSDNGAPTGSPEFYTMNDTSGRGPKLSSVPEPSSALLASLSILGLGFGRRRRNRSSRIA